MISILEGGRIVLWRMEVYGWGGGLVVSDPWRALFGCWTAGGRCCLRCKWYDCFE